MEISNVRSWISILFEDKYKGIDVQMYEILTRMHEGHASQMVAAFYATWCESPSADYFFPPQVAHIGIVT